VGRVLHGAPGMRLRRTNAGFTGRVLHGAHGKRLKRPSAGSTRPVDRVLHGAPGMRLRRSSACSTVDQWVEFYMVHVAYDGGGLMYAQLG
jgi:hypothetical protein